MYENILNSVNVELRIASRAVHDRSQPVRRATALVSTAAQSAVIGRTQAHSSAALRRGAPTKLAEKRQSGRKKSDLLEAAFFFIP